MEGHCTLTTRWHLDYFKRERRCQILISYREEGSFFTAFKQGLILINFMQPKYRTWGRSKLSRIRLQNGDLLQVQVFSTTKQWVHIHTGAPRKYVLCPSRIPKTLLCIFRGGGGWHSAQPLRSNPHSGPSITNRTLTIRQHHPPLQFDQLANHDEANKGSM